MFNLVSIMSRTSFTGTLENRSTMSWEIQISSASNFRNYKMVFRLFYEGVDDVAHSFSHL